MIGCHKCLDLIEVVKVVENVVLKDDMELVLNACDDRILLIDVQSKIIERFAPVKFVKIKQFEIVKHLAHACLHFSLIKEVFLCQDAPVWHFLSGSLKPRVVTFKPVSKTQVSMCSMGKVLLLTNQVDLTTLSISSLLTS